MQKAFAYPTPQGPGTFAVAVCAAPTATSKNRDISTTTVTGTIKPWQKTGYTFLRVQDPAAPTRWVTSFAGGFLG